jgi:hypothetical protein
MQLLDAARLARLAVVACAIFCSAPSDGYAQDGGAGTEPGAADVRVDPETGERFRWVRPDEEIRRGALQVPSWLVIAGGITVAGAAAAILFARARRRG